MGQTNPEQHRKFITSSYLFMFLALFTVITAVLAYWLARKVAVANDLEYIALSFVSDERDIKSFREYLDSIGGEKIKIIAKVERQQAIDNIIPIIDVADAIMVARGDMGVEIGVEKVPKTQKMIIRESNRRIKPVIVATQMLESMINSNTATRAEVSDVANAIYDGCDAVMLSGETAVGENPENVIHVMKNICEASDKHMVEIKKEDQISKNYFFQKTRATSFCKAADQIAEENRARAIMAFTSSGNTPLIASKLNSVFPIIAPTDDENVFRSMSIFRGVIPMMMPKNFKDIARWTNMIDIAVKKAKSIGWVNKGDTLVVTAGIPLGQSNGINSIRIITVK